MELVRSAPGVWAMSARETSAVGVTVSTLAVCGLGGDVDGGGDAAELELEVQDGRGVGVEGEGLLEGLKARVSDGDGVVAEGNVGEGE